MQKTTNYELNIIEPEIDNIDPTPINENMEIIDNALVGAFSLENPPHIIGSYVGDGAENKFINLGFTPSAVYVGYAQMYGLAYKFMSASDGGDDMFWGGFALQSFPANFGETPYCLVEITEGGFNVSKTDLQKMNSNQASAPYVYIAFK